MSNKNEQIIITCNYMERSKQSQLGAKKKKKKKKNRKKKEKTKK